MNEKLKMHYFIHYASLKFFIFENKYIYIEECINNLYNLDTRKDHNIIKIIYPLKYENN